MLSAEQVQQLGKTIGFTPGTSSNSPQSTDDWEKELRGAAKGGPEPSVQNAQPQEQPGIFTRVGKDISGRLNDLGTTWKQAAAGEINPASTGIQTTGAVGGAVMDVGTELLKSLYHTIGSPFSKDIRGGLEALAQSETGQKLGQVLSDFSQKHPEAAADFKGALDTIGGITTLTSAGELKNLAQQKIAQGLEKAGGLIAEKSAQKAAQEEAGNLSKIQDLITPKPTIKEAKLATQEGRLIKGKEPTLFKSGKPDTVLPSEKTVSSAKTIQKNIPNAHSMDEATLHSELENKTSEIAQDLKPKMQEVPIKEKQIKDITNKWEEIKAAQREESEFADNLAGNKKEQAQFETRLNKVKEAKNLDDIWDARKSYDDSIKQNVKSANEMSDAKLQYRKEMWLQNRAILNGAIHDAESGLGKESRQAFSEMHDMYNAKESLLSKAKVETKIKPSKIAQFSKKPVVKAAIRAGEIGLGLKGLKNLSGL